MKKVVKDVVKEDEELWVKYYQPLIGKQEKSYRLFLPKIIFIISLISLLGFSTVFAGMTISASGSKTNKNSNDLKNKSNPTMVPSPENNIPSEMFEEEEVQNSPSSTTREPNVTPHITKAKKKKVVLPKKNTPTPVVTPTPVNTPTSVEIPVLTPEPTTQPTLESISTTTPANTDSNTTPVPTSATN